MSLTLEEYTYYQRQCILPQIGVVGQLRLKQGRVLCVGAGGLGCLVLTQLVTAGVGTVGVIDGDCVSLSNLHRQSLYTMTDVGLPKVSVACDVLTHMNPHVTLMPYHMSLTDACAHDIIAAYDLIVDCSDNAYTRYLINDVCFELQKPFVFAGISEWQGQGIVFEGQTGPCLRCVFPESTALQSCTEQGVLNVVPGFWAIWQATQVLRWMLGEALPWRVLHTGSVWDNTWHTYPLTQAAACPCCVLRQPRATLRSDAVFCTLQTEEISWSEFNKQLLSAADLLVLDVRAVADAAWREAMPDTYQHIALSDLSARVTTVALTRKIVCVCHQGVASRQAAALLRAHGGRDVAWCQLQTQGPVLTGVALYQNASSDNHSDRIVTCFPLKARANAKTRVARR